MKIRIKKNLLNESKLDSYSNVWKSWKTFKDFQKWNLSQVSALAKHRKGQGRFDFRFYDKVYEDLKEFLTRAKEISQHERAFHSYIHTIFNHMEAKDKIFFQLFGGKYVPRNGQDIFEWLEANHWLRELGQTSKDVIDDGRLEQELKNMESLRETYPWNKKYLGNIQKHLGIYEKKIKKH